MPDADLLDRVKATGAVVIGNATSVEEARWLESAGVDAIIAQGFEAGGHTGRFLGADPAEALGLFALLPQIADAVSVPVIAAGGIADGRGIAAAFSSAQAPFSSAPPISTRPKPPISDAHRARLKDGRTVFTNLMTGGLARGLRGRLIDELGPVRGEAPPYPLASAALAPIRAAAEKRGEYGFGPMWAGQAAPLGTALPAAELTRKLAADALAILAGASVERGQWKSSRSLRSATIISGSSTTRRAARRRWSIPAMPRRFSPRQSARGWTIDQVWNTHWHPDHTGGNLAIKEATGRTHLGTCEPRISPAATLRCRKATRSASAITSAG